MDMATPGTLSCWRIDLNSPSHIVIIGVDPSLSCVNSGVLSLGLVAQVASAMNGIL